MNKFWSLMVLCVLAFVTSVQASEYNHRVSLFGGVVDQIQESDASFGLEYEYRPFKFIGIGGGYELSGGTFQDDGLNVAFGTVTLHPFWGLRVSGSLGEASVGHHWDGVDSTFRRYTVGYDVAMTKHFVVSPVWSMDRVNQTDFQTYGIQLGFTL